MARRSSGDSPAAKKPGAWTAATLPRLVLIVGAESALREEALEKIRKVAFGGGDGGMNWVVFFGPNAKNEADALTPATFIDEACTAGMFAAPDEPKIVAVRQGGLFLADKEYREMVERAQMRLPQTSTLVIEAADPGSLKTTNFYKALDKAGAVILCEALANRWGDTQDLELEIEKRAAARNLKLSPGALNALLERSTRSLAVIDEEIGKLALALRPAESGGDKTPVGEDDVAEFCAATRTFNAFNFADAIAERDLKRSLEVLGAIFDRGIADSAKPGKVVTNDGTIAILLLGALTWRITQLQDFQAALDNGKREHEAFGEARIFGLRQEAFRRALRRHNTLSLRRAVQAIYAANLNLRRGGGTRPQEVLEEMVWAMAGRH